MSEDPPLYPELLMSDKEWKELREKMLTRVPTLEEFEGLKTDIEDIKKDLEDIHLVFLNVATVKEVKELEKRVAELEHEVKSLKLWKANKR